MQISELKSQAEGIKQKEAKETQSRKDAEDQMKTALEAAFMKSTEGATQNNMLKQEIERVKADSKKNQDTLTTTFMTQISELEE